VSTATNIVSNDEFQHRRFTKIANEFVEIYDNDPLEAAAFARSAVAQKDYNKLRMHITNAFVRAGWSFE